MPASRLDTVYRKILFTKFFTKGWGNPEHLLRLFAFRKLVSKRDTCYQLVDKNYPVTVINEATWSDCRVIEGKFKSPLALHLPDVVPSEVQDAYFQMILPLKWKCSKYKPICIHLAGTGDHYFWKRRSIMAKPLLKADIGAIILENPFYGLRKPKDQIRSCLHNVSDIFVMGGSLILECLVLLHWCEKLEYGPLGLSGLSMGGHMASLAATNWPKPIVLVPCLSWSTASTVFTKGVLSESIDWKLLQNQYESHSLFYNVLTNLISDNDEIPSVSKYFITKHTKQFLEFVRQTEKIVFKEVQNCSNIEKKRKKESDLIPSIDKIKHCGYVSQKVVSGINFLRLLNRNTESENVSSKPADAVHFMRCIMDECTHLKKFSVPNDTSLIIAVCAQADGYVPREGCSSLEEIWPGATIRYINAGHVSAYIWYRKFFRSCIIEAFEKAKAKYS